MGRAGRRPSVGRFFFFNDTATTEIYTLSLHDALPIWHPEGRWRRRAATALGRRTRGKVWAPAPLPVATGSPRSSSCAPVGTTRSPGGKRARRSEEHTSELQSRPHLVCRLLLGNKNTER